MIKYIIILIIFIIGYNILINNKNIENFGLPIWNIGTRFYPPYDIRGYVYNMYPFLFISPYYYTTNGNYVYNKKLSDKIKNII